jgi:hypothetical protein
MPDAGCRMPDAGCRMPDATKSNLTRLDVKERLDLESGIWCLISADWAGVWAGNVLTI